MIDAAVVDGSEGGALRTGQGAGSREKRGDQWPVLTLLPADGLI